MGHLYRQIQCITVLKSTLLSITFTILQTLNCIWKNILHSNLNREPTTFCSDRSVAVSLVLAQHSAITICCGRFSQKHIKLICSHSSLLRAQYGVNAPLCNAAGHAGYDCDAYLSLPICLFTQLMSHCWDVSAKWRWYKQGRMFCMIIEVIERRRH